jgi:hypothetical protein
MTGRTFAALVIVGATAFGLTSDSHAQGLSLDVSAGRLVYDPIAVNVSTNNLVGSLRYDARSGLWVYGAAAAPLGQDDTFWTAAGAGGRIVAARPANRRMTLGADVGAYGVSFRDAIADQVGTGATVEAIPFARVDAGLAFVEARGGWRGHTLSFAGVRDNRTALETGARAGYGLTWRIEGDARWVRAAEGSWPFAAATLSYNRSSLQAWGQAGKWMGGSELNDASWAAGLAIAVGTGSQVWATVGQEAPDPLYWNIARRTWSVGMTRRLGSRPPSVLTTARERAGDVLVSIRVADAPDGDVSIGGDFNNWQPAPMRREGNRWITRLPLPPGLYHYAFRSGTGEWFVPSDTPGRRDDGMGGDVAVLLVM